MKKVANLLESLVAEIATLESIATKAKGVTNRDLRALLEGARSPKIKAHAAHVGGEADLSYFKVLMANAIRELNRVADLTDEDADFPEFAEEGKDDGFENEETPEENTSEAPLPDESMDTTLDTSLDTGLAGPPETISSEVSGETVLAPNPEVTVDIHIDGEGVEIVHGEDDKLYVVLPENAVLSLHTASVEETRMVLEKLNRSLPTKE